MKAISPVIATVIIVAVAIAISIAVALWAAGLVAPFTRVERLEITYAHAEYNETIDAWTVTLKIANRGTSDATITTMLINNRDFTHKLEASKFIKAGAEVEYQFILSKNEGFSSGQIIQILINTAAGNQYPKQIHLP
ncbi:MAG: DUF4352 domain-containing protein [Desulfurococcaceae archaeon]